MRHSRSTLRSYYPEKLEVSLKVEQNYLHHQSLTIDLLRLVTTMVPQQVIQTMIIGFGDTAQEYQKAKMQQSPAILQPVETLQSITAIGLNH